MLPSNKAYEGIYMDADHVEYLVLYIFYLNSSPNFFFIMTKVDTNCLCDNSMW